LERSSVFEVMIALFLVVKRAREMLEYQASLDTQGGQRGITKRTEFAPNRAFASEWAGVSIVA